MRQHFLLDADLIFLNHGSFGACPRVVIEAQHQIQLDIERNPCQFFARRSAAALSSARLVLARFIGASADDLVFIENATVGVNVVAHSLKLSPGDEILASNHEYGACEEAWRRRCKQSGAVYRSVDVVLPFDAAQMVEAFRRAITPATRVFFISHITSPTALVFPIEQLIELAHRHGIMVVIDGAHGPAFLDLELNRLGADFYTGNCHKWMCAPKGAGFLHVRADRHQLLDSPIVSWGQVNAGGGTSPLDSFTGTSVMERELQWLGTRDLSAALCVPVALEFLAAHDWWQQRVSCRALAQQFGAELAKRLKVDALTTHQVEAQMIAVALPSCNAETLRQYLFERHNIEMPITSHGGRQYARVSVQAYNTEAELELLIKVLPKALADLGSI